MRSPNALAIEGQARSSPVVGADIAGLSGRRKPLTGDGIVSRLGDASEHGVRRGTCPYGSR